MARQSHQRQSHFFIGIMDLTVARCVCVPVGANQSTSQESPRKSQAKGTQHHCVAQSAVIGSACGSDQVSCVGLSVFSAGESASEERTVAKGCGAWLHAREGTTVARADGWSMSTGGRRFTNRLALMAICRCCRRRIRIASKA